MTTKRLPHGYKITKGWTGWNVVRDRPGGGLFDVGTAAATLREATALAVGHYERRRGAGAWELDQTPTRCAHVNKHLPTGWELVTGDGYLYFVNNDPDKFETRSVMTPRLGDQRVREWLEDFLYAQKEVTA